jgi:molecular chaperone GrpE
MAGEETEENPQDDGGTCELIPSAVQKAMDDKDRKITELTDDLKRLQAEFENFKKRNEKEWSERVKFANQWIISDLLMVLDSFDKAMEDTKECSEANHLKDGVKRVERQFRQILEREGVKEIDTKGKFDPFLHEAIMREERDDVEDGKILEVYQKGYILGSKAIRPAKVKVANKADTEQPPVKKTAEKAQDEEEEPDIGQYEIK